MERIKFNDPLAVEVLKNGEVLAFPTETVYGLGVRFDNKKAYDELIKVKNRPSNKHFTLMVGNLDCIGNYSFVNSRIKRVMDKFMPGQLTIILKSKDSVPNYVCGKECTIGIRCPNSERLRKLINDVGVPLLVPSANKSGKAPCSSVDEVIKEFNNKFKYVIDDIITMTNVPSTVVDFTNEEPRLIREGNISIEEIKEIYYE